MRVEAIEKVLAFVGLGYELSGRVDEITPSITRLRKGLQEVSFDFHPNGQMHYIIYSKEGLPHRPPDEGPARAYWREDGEIYFIDYKTKGLTHRPVMYGPAQFNLNVGLIPDVKWVVMGKEILFGYSSTPQSRVDALEKAIADANRIP